MNDKRMRQEVIEYIISKLNNYTAKRDLFLINRCLNRWKTDEIFDTHLYIDDIIAISTDLSHPLKWLIDYKLYKLEEIRRSKPIAPTEYPSSIGCIKYMSNINNIRYKLYETDNRLNYYIIKINIKHIPNTVIIYKKPNSNIWFSKRREYCQLYGPYSK